MKNLIPLMKFAAIAGNVLFMLWMTYNGLKEHFSGTLPEKVSYVGLMCLLILNSWLILSAEKRKTA
jgi:Flp pilus assembly protein protease CpaA